MRGRLVSWVVQREVALSGQGAWWCTEMSGKEKGKSSDEMGAKAGLRGSLKRGEF